MTAWYTRDGDGWPKLFVYDDCDPFKGLNDSWWASSVFLAEGEAAQMIIGGTHLGCRKGQKIMVEIPPARRIR